MPRIIRVVLFAVPVLAAAALVLAAVIPTTLLDFYVRGTQNGAVVAANFQDSHTCALCHGGYDDQNDPMATWSGSLMGQAGRDPLFFAQMATANQDAANAGYYCLRCHVPNAFITGHAAQPDGSTLNGFDKDGVSCHLCHAMVDPIYKPGISPPGDLAILGALPGGPPTFYGNSAYVLDPQGVRRGPRTDALPMHTVVPSPFHQTGAFCGTCHEVGNLAVTRQPSGYYAYNALNQASPTEHPDGQFPLERTYSEWRLSAFANGGVDMGDRFGGARGPVMSTCQDCHMPTVEQKACAFGVVRPDMARHEFAGAGAQVLDIIAKFTQNDPAVDQDAIARGRAAAVSMLQRAATLELSSSSAGLGVRVINESGHKLPTGHIEGRRVWVNVRFLDAAGALVAERGRYDHVLAELDDHDTTVFEMHVGLSPEAAALTGYPAGPTGHMALADVIVKDNRIPPRGYAIAAYESAGAPVVGAFYADGQHWADLTYAVPPGSTRAEVRLYYQNTPKEYIEHLRDGNHTNDWGNILYSLWVQTGRGAPIEMAVSVADLPAAPCNSADLTGVGAPPEGPAVPDGRVTVDDLLTFVHSYLDASGCPGDPGVGCNPADLTDLGDTGAGPDGQLTLDDILSFINAYNEGC